MSYETEAMDRGLREVYKAIEKPGRSLHAKDVEDELEEKLFEMVDAMTNDLKIAVMNMLLHYKGERNPGYERKLQVHKEACLLIQKFL